MLKNILLSFIPILLIAKPVRVDEILTEKKSFKLYISTSYTNINRKDSTLAPLQYQTQNGDFVTIPTYLGDSRSNQDYLGYALSLRYGVNKDIEIFSSVNLYTSDTHFSAGNQFDTINQNGFNSLNLGFTYKVKKEDERPSLLIGASTTAIDRTIFTNSTKNIHFKGYNLFATSFYTVDPVVFLLKASYGLNLKKENNNTTIDSGEIFILSPQIYFAVNPYTSMNWGVKYRYRGKDKVDGIVVSSNGSRVSYLFGTSYEINTKMTLNVDAEYSNSTSTSQNSIAFGLSYKF